MMTLGDYQRLYAKRWPPVDGGADGASRRQGHLPAETKGTCMSRFRRWSAADSGLPQSNTDSLTCPTAQEANDFVWQQSASTSATAYRAGYLRDAITSLSIPPPIRDTIVTRYRRDNKISPPPLAPPPILINPVVKTHGEIATR
ncbi:hypothetical protein EVAR_34202_1 [Eumeta japonica]|uniref:Uncharacterized protein n=1 Tax=Eumeta variegata TaxID=151549 RepID=A0A4C1WKQ4_EUMVA|nr:hypothetical protein EVAR_34202_1 [Eumeta japonica]